jgi:hypothetical protein
LESWVAQLARKSKERSVATRKSGRLFIVDPSCGLREPVCEGTGLLIRIPRFRQAAPVPD